MANITVSKEQLAQRLDRAKAMLKSAKMEGQRMAELGAHAALTAGGGIASGIVSVKMPKLPGTDIDTDLAIGGGLCALALLDVGGDWSDELNAFGAGMLAAGAARETQKALARQ